MDLSGATLLDAAAVSALVGVNTHSDDARLAIACAQPDMLRVFETSGLDHSFAILATADDALAHVRKEAAHAG